MNVKRIASCVVAAATVAALGCEQPVHFADTPAYLLPSDDAVDFAAREIDKPHRRTLTIVNKGERALHFEDPVGEGLGGVFGVSLDTYDVDPGGQAQLEIVFRPADSVPYETAYTFTNDSENAPTFTVTVIGEGVPTDACSLVVCDTPPRAWCVNIDTSQRYAPMGVCDGGQCTYGEVVEACAFGCDDETSGRCRPDPCLTDPCTTPPSGGCFLRVGICIDGACAYEPRLDGVCDDHDPCTVNDTCVFGDCLGAARSCDAAPPHPECADANTRRVYAPGGTCDAATGQCRYNHDDIACQHGCVGDGQCAPDPCTGVVCNTPPNGCYDQVGTCEGGACRYPLRQAIDCNDGDACTLNDKCVEGFCVGQQKNCVTPPQAVCVAADRALEYANPGTCSHAGVCDYETREVHCPYGCSIGGCRQYPIWGDDVLKVEMDFDRNPGQPFEYDDRDVDLHVQNPRGTDCSVARPAQVLWDGTFGHCIWSASPDAFRFETITHSGVPDEGGQGTYTIRLAYVDSCSNVTCFGNICACYGVASSSARVRISVNGELWMHCTYRFVIDPEAVPALPAYQTIATIQRINGYLQPPVAYQGVTCVVDNPQPH